MGTSKEIKIIPLRANWQRRLAQQRPTEVVSEGDRVSDAFFYTLDLLMEDFGKKHQGSQCALCEPMKVVGQHRDVVMVGLAIALFTTFFPSFENYILEMKDNLLQGLLDRRDRKDYGSWKEKIKVLVEDQIKKDLSDFLQDIQKHLLKYTGNPLEESRFEQIYQKALSRLQKEWVGKGR